MVRFFSSFWGSERGAVAVYFALMSPVLIGFTALGAEAGYWLMMERRLQHIADTSAYSGAVRGTKDSLPDITLTQQAAIESATRSGLDLAAGSTITVNRPPQAGNFTGDSDFTEVNITMTLPRYFSAIYSSEDVTLRVRAVAGIDENSGDPVCMLSLSSSNISSFVFGGSAAVDLGDCALATNSPSSRAILMQGGRAAVSGSCIYSVGEVALNDRVTLSNCDAPRTFSRPTIDPYANIAMPLVTGTAQNRVTLQDYPASAPYVPPEIHPDGMRFARFTGGLNFRRDVTLSPGLYIIDGGSLRINAGAVVSGEGVSFYLTNGATLSVNGGAELNLSATTDNAELRPDPYSGLLFFSDRTGPSVTHRFNGNASSQMDGALYFPADTVEWSGTSSGSRTCIQILGNELNISGNGTLEISCFPRGVPVIRAEQRIGLAE